MGERPRRVFLLGATGSGKTTVGTALAGLLGGEFQAPESGSEDFVRNPQLAKQRLLDYTLQMLGEENGPGQSPVVVELPPSALLDQEARVKLSKARRSGDIAVLLDAPIEVLARRAGLSAPQMGFLGTPRAWFRALYRELHESYLGMYDTAFDTGSKDPLSIAQEVADTCGLN